MRASPLFAALHPGTPRPRARGALLALFPTLLALSPVVAAAQAGGSLPPASFGGTVRDTAGEPIPTAGVEIDGDGAWKAVSADGAFLFPALRAGPHTVRVRALGFGSLAQSFLLAPGDSAGADVVLARVALALDTVRTSAAPRLYGPREFQERRQRGRGSFLTRDEFERRAPTRLSDLLGQLAGVQRYPHETPLGTTEYIYVMRGVATPRGEICPVNIYLDGRSFDVGPGELDRIARPDEIDAIEVYAGGSQVPPRFSGPTAACGVIALWTRDAAR